MFRGFEAGGVFPEGQMAPILGKPATPACAIRAELTEQLRRIMDQVVRLTRQLMESAVVKDSDLRRILNSRIGQVRAERDVLLCEYARHVNEHGCSISAIRRSNQE